MKIIRYYVSPSRTTKSKWIVTSVALDEQGKEYNTNKVCGIGSKRWMKELSKQLNQELQIK